MFALWLLLRLFFYLGVFLLSVAVRRVLVQPVIAYKHPLSRFLSASLRCISSVGSTQSELTKEFIHSMHFFGLHFYIISARGRGSAHLVSLPVLAGEKEKTIVCLIL